MNTFYLGTHRPGWLGKTSVPLFVSHRTLGKRVGLPIATGRWALDSGGFSELSMYGEWRTSEDEYIAAAERYQEIGGFDWAAPQDWMCEPFMLQKTGLSIREHQKRTIMSVLRLRGRSTVRWIPVIQGWEMADYAYCIRAYAANGIDLTKEPTVGIGSVCRRQNRRLYTLHGESSRLDGGRAR